MLFVDRISLSRDVGFHCTATGIRPGGKGVTNGRPPHLAKNERDTPNFLHAALARAACAPFFKERRMESAEPNKLYRKSGIWGTRVGGRATRDRLEVNHGAGAVASLVRAQHHLDEWRIKSESAGFTRAWWSQPTISTATQAESGPVQRGHLAGPENVEPRPTARSNAIHGDRFGGVWGLGLPISHFRRAAR
jgi:hypothetical protein